MGAPKKFKKRKLLYHSFEEAEIDICIKLGGDPNEISRSAIRNFNKNSKSEEQELVEINIKIEDQIKELSLEHNSNKLRLREIQESKAQNDEIITTLYNKLKIAADIKKWRDGKYINESERQTFINHIKDYTDEKYTGNLLNLFLSENPKFTEKSLVVWSNGLNGGNGDE